MRGARCEVLGVARASLIETDNHLQDALECGYLGLDEYERVTRPAHRAVAPEWLPLAGFRPRVSVLLRRGGWLDAGEARRYAPPHAFPARQAGPALAA